MLMIVEHLSIEDLPVVQRVIKATCFLVNETRRLQEKMFMVSERQPPVGALPVPCNRPESEYPLYHQPDMDYTINPLVQRIFPDWFSTWFACPLDDYPNMSKADRLTALQLDHPSFFYPKASWRYMLISQPALMSMQVTILAEEHSTQMLTTKFESMFTFDEGSRTTALQMAHVYIQNMQMQTHILYVAPPGETAAAKTPRQTNRIRLLTIIKLKCDEYKALLKKSIEEARERIGSTQHLPVKYTRLFCRMLTAGGMSIGLLSAPEMTPGQYAGMREPGYLLPNIRNAGRNYLVGQKMYFFIQETHRIRTLISPRNSVLNLQLEAAGNFDEYHGQAASGGLQPSTILMIWRNGNPSHRVDHTCRLARRSFSSTTRSFHTQRQVGDICTSLNQSGTSSSYILYITPTRMVSILCP